MKVLFVLEAGIPEYRNFLFEKLSKENKITKLLVLHNGRVYNGKGDYESKKLRFIGSRKLGFHIGILKYIFKYDIVVSTYNLRIISCWLPVFFKKKWIFWGKGLGKNEATLVKKLREITAQKATMLLVYNNFKRDELLQKINILPQKVIAYNNTIMIKNPGIDINSPKTYFLYFGRIQKRKGLKELLLEYKKFIGIANPEKRIKLRFVGNGDYSTELKQTATNLKITDSVEFFPGVYDDESIKKHFLNALAYISPYNVGLSIINSFAYGVPVVTCTNPQSGPEYHYLNESNSFRLKDINQIHQILKDLSEANLKGKSEYCHQYYLENLTPEFMYSNFYNAIIQAYNK